MRLMIRYPSNITIGIWHPGSTDKESDIEYVESRIHGVESRIQNCLGFSLIHGAIGEVVTPHYHGSKIFG